MMYDLEMRHKKLQRGGAGRKVIENEVEVNADRVNLGVDGVAEDEFVGDQLMDKVLEKRREAKKRRGMDG